nr:hypothetical protein BaRGS_000551 [Batillaria attramentaria]
MLLNHVKSVHSAYSSNPEHVDYLESLKRDARILCPHCPGKQYLSNTYKYFVHLTNFHRDQMDSSNVQLSEVSSYQCEICMVVFKERKIA